MNSKFYALTLVAVALILSVGAVGCGPASEAKAPIAGQVTLDGAPLPSGTVYLRRSDGEFFSVDVAEGKFVGEAMPGEYRIEISAIRESTPDATAVAMYGADAPTQRVNYIPARYNSDSKLTATVPDGGTANLKFELEAD
ncbi:hypothetical protein [Blastopirellula marina]|uniref:Carboxypeptidase regulatory-like domain-containing protein n=1 Tax=Blastopirellula marina TaxID=124 RepID=A0A2S8GA93_9BACT|nr:hypothetical protein [Blastopirellula marina]PQO35446.1 hypothetical protein C5Y98_13880 [Blastopirellula marina]PQO41382.1 hypothetical protein C5Y93_30155 [Blastopirellula marina]PTL44086.1 hypothetical protein C5Y97_13890 [Blastopirellula marina]